ncbi:MAG: hypothetical protein ACI9SF_000283 [Candidatus Nanohaloarchaea archaeon]|jgi:hypothetical protein
METYEIAATVILLSAGIGLLTSIGFSQPVDDQTDTQETHEHALFHVVINGSERDFTDQKFQLNSQAVHLENNKSDIVHKHRTGVQWSQFLDTINTTYWRSNSTGNLCVSIYSETDCGSGAVYLNGEKTEDLNQEIFQGDSLLIVLNTENQTAVVNEYTRQQLPPEYKPPAVRGNRA